MSLSSPSATTKDCKSCHVTKPISDFTTTQTSCKSCRAIAAKSQRQASKLASTSHSTIVTNPRHDSMSPIATNIITDIQHQLHTLNLEVQQIRQSPTLIMPPLTTCTSCEFLKSKIVDLEKQLLDQTSESQNNINTMNHTKQQIDQLNKIKDQLEQEISQLRKTTEHDLKLRDTEISSLALIISQQKEKLESQASSTAKVDTLNLENADLNKKLTHADDQIKLLRIEIAKLQHPTPTSSPSQYPKPPFSPIPFPKIHPYQSPTK